MSHSPSASLATFVPFSSETRRSFYENNAAKEETKITKRSVFPYNSQKKCDPGFLCDFQKK